MDLRFLFSTRDALFRAEMSKFALSQKRLVGRTSLELPIFGLGGAAYMFGDSGRWACSLSQLQAGKRSQNGFRFPSDDQVQNLLHSAYSNGVRFFDTSPWYGRGQSEHRLGRFLYDIEDRKSFVVNTKVGRLLKRPYVTQKLNHQTQGSYLDSMPGLKFDHVHDYTYSGIMRSFEDSLQRLGMPSIDMLTIHDLDTMHFPSELLQSHLTNLSTSGIRALEELKASGAIKAYGAGINGVGDITRFLSYIDVDFFLVSQIYTLLHHRAPANEYCNPNLTGGSVSEFNLVQERGASIIPCAIFNSGILVQGPSSDAVCNYRKATQEEISRVIILQEVCSQFGVLLPSAAIQFALQHPLVAGVICGFGNQTEFEQGKSWLEASIPDDFWRTLVDKDLIHPHAVPLAE